MYIYCVKDYFKNSSMISQIFAADHLKKPGLRNQDHYKKGVSVLILQDSGLCLKMAQKNFGNAVYREHYRMQFGSLKTTKLLFHQS